MICLHNKPENDGGERCHDRTLASAHDPRPQASPAAGTLTYLHLHSQLRIRQQEGRREEVDDGYLDEHSKMSGLRILVPVKRVIDYAVRHAFTFTFTPASCTFELQCLFQAQLPLSQCQIQSP